MESTYMGQTILLLGREKEDSAWLNLNPETKGNSGCVSPAMYVRAISPDLTMQKGKCHT